jgi:biotin carboxyl carrier protein
MDARGIGRPLQACMLALFATSVLHCSPSRAQEEPSSATAFKAVVRIVSGSGYFISAPADGTLLVAPEYGRVYQPLEGSPLWGYPTSVKPEPGEAAEIQYADSVEQTLRTQEKRVEALDLLLRDYGQRDSMRPFSNAPWVFEQNEALRANEQSLAAQLPDSKESLEALRATLKALMRSGAQTHTVPANIDRWLQELGSIPSTIGHSDVKTPTPLAILDKVVTFKLRETLGLNSTEHWMSFVLPDVYDTEPNNSNAPYLAVGPLQFEIPRLTDGAREEPGMLGTFCHYWTEVSAQDLFSDQDVSFLTALSHNSFKGQATSPKVATVIVSECKAAAEEIRNWRESQESLARFVSEHASYVLEEHQALENLNAAIAFFAATLKQDNPVLVDQELTGLKNALQMAIWGGRENKLTGRPHSSLVPIAWVADQRRPGHQFRPYKTFSLRESQKMRWRQDIAPVHSTPTFEILRIKREGIWLPEDDFATLEGMTSDLPANSSVEDPFKDRISQTLLTLSPTVLPVSAADEASPDELFAVGRTVQLFSADLRRNLEQEALKVRARASELSTKTWQQREALRGGHIVVPEPSMVDSVFVKVGEPVAAGTPIATLHPVYRVRLEVPVPSDARISSLLVPGVRMSVRLSCDGWVGSTAAQRTAILKSAQKVTLLNSLRLLKAKYFAANTFTGMVDFVASEDSGPNGEHRLVKIAVSLPENQRSVTIPKKDFPAEADRMAELLSSVGFKSSDSGTAVETALEAGPFDLGDRCQGEFALPISDARTQTQSDWERARDSVHP